VLARLWQRQAEIDIESGRRPLVGLGLGNVDAEGLLALLAVQRFSQRAGAVAEPQVVAGDGDLWLSALMLRPPTDEDAPSTFEVTYGGGDVATYAASLTIATAPHLGPRTTPLPPGMAWMLTPTALPGSERADLEFLPLAQNGAPFAPVSAPQATSPHWIDQMEAWAVLVFALALLVAAIFV
jgi:hypothetical protein